MKILTPPTMPDEVIIRELEIPSSQEWLGVFNFLLLQATYTWAWEQLYDTDLTPAEAAAKCYEIYVKYLTSTGAPSEVEAPYWDTDEDVDDSLPVDAQPWYGTVSDPEAPPAELDFAENALVWVFTGFVALASWEIGFAPAILFHTIAPKFLLASKRGDVGEIIRILVDGQEAARVDTSSYAPGEVIHTPIIADPDITTGHDIMIVQVS